MIDTIFAAAQHYIENLDWTYMMSFMFIAHFLAKDSIVNWMPFKVKGILKRVPMSWRVILIGLFYGAFVYWVREYQGREGVEKIVQSLSFAVIFHKLLLNKIIKKLTKK